MKKGSSVPLTGIKPGVKKPVKASPQIMKLISKNEATHPFFYTVNEVCQKKVPTNKMSIVLIICLYAYVFLNGIYSL